MVNDLSSELLALLGFATSDATLDRYKATYTFKYPALQMTLWLALKRAFEIVVTNDNGEEVRYTAWAETELVKQWKNSNIPYKEGDVIRYYAGKKFGDDYEVGGVE